MAHELDTAMDETLLRPQLQLQRTKTLPSSASQFGDAPLSRKEALFVFVMFTQVVQALMSFDGGATQFSTSALKQGGWTPWALGLLGAMDKFGQVATAFIWGEVLMQHDAKPLLVIGLFWKALCCFLFGLLQRQNMRLAVIQLSMLLAKLGMGITEALVSVWATVWVQRNAPAHARAQWLTLAGVSAGIGNGSGSGFASLWDPVMAFFFQASVLWAIWILLFCFPAKMFRFGGAAGGDESPSNEKRMRSSMPDPTRMLAEQVGREMVQPGFATLVNIESMRYPGYFLDATADPMDVGWKVRITRGDPNKGDRAWALFKMRQVPCRQGNKYTFESTRLPGHYLAATTETGCWQRSRMRVLISEEGASQFASEFRLRSPSPNALSFASWMSPCDTEQIALFESVALPGHYLDATSEKEKLVSVGDRLKVCVTRGKLEKGNWAHFKIHKVTSEHFVRELSPAVTDGVSERLLFVLLNKPVWLWTAMSISLCCFVTSGVSFLWQNTVASLWGFSNASSFGWFAFSTGVGGFVGVAVGPRIFDTRLGGFSSSEGTATCLHWCKQMMLIAALCGTISTLLLGEKACRLVEVNAPQVIYWHLAVLITCVFAIFALLNSITGTLYGINTEAVGADMRTFAAGLTVSFQNVFGFAFGPLLPSCVADLVGRIVQDVWPGIPWNKGAVDGARFAVGMASALAATWLLFFFTRAAAISARVLHINTRGQSQVQVSP